MVTLKTHIPEELTNNTDQYIQLKKTVLYLIGVGDITKIKMNTETYIPEPEFEEQGTPQ